MTANQKEKLRRLDNDNCDYVITQFIEIIESDFRGFHEEELSFENKQKILEIIRGSDNKQPLNYDWLIFCQQELSSDDTKIDIRGMEIDEITEHIQTLHFRRMSKRKAQEEALEKAREKAGRKKAF